MSIQFLAADIWRQITTTAKGRTRGTAFVAVPYFGKEGRRLLPLRAGDTLLVNASEAAVKSGQTYPSGLLRLLNEGVKIYTLSNLHAKVYVFGATAFVGSANASASSRDKLHEAVIRMRDAAVALKARRHIQHLCTEPLLGRELERLAKLYREPRRPRRGKRTTRSEKKEEPRMFLAQVSEDEIGTQYEKDLKVGEREARANRQDRHSTIDSVWRRELPYRMGDTVIQVFETAYGALWVYPRAKVINRKIVPRGERKMTIVYLEVPDRPRRRLVCVERYFLKKDRARLRKDGQIHASKFRDTLLEILG